MKPYYEWPPPALPGRLVDGVRLLAPAELAQLLSKWGEYSCSMPTGLYVGKRFFRNKNAYHCACVDNTHARGRCEPDWWMAEIRPDPDPKYVNIFWEQVRLDPEVLAHEVEVKILEARPGE